jgi:hypothetical protein
MTKSRFQRFYGESERALLLVDSWGDHKYSETAKLAVGSHRASALLVVWTTT